MLHKLIFGEVKHPEADYTSVIQKSCCDEFRNKNTCEGSLYFKQLPLATSKFPWLVTLQNTMFFKDVFVLSLTF